MSRQRPGTDSERERCRIGNVLAPSQNTGTSKRRLVAEKARRQEGLVGSDDLRALGITRHLVHDWVTQGYLFPRHRGVYSVGHHLLSRRGELLGALMAAGEDAFLSHVTGLGVHGAWSRSTREIHVTVPVSGCNSRGNLRLHRTKHPPHPGEVVIRNGLQVSSVERALVEVAPAISRKVLDALIAELARREQLNIERATAALDRHARRPGIGKLRQALHDYLPRPERKSSLERAFDHALQENPDIPPPLTNVYLRGWEIDCYWPEQRVALELDGRPYHVAKRDTERDRLKDAKLMGLGIWPLRITDRRFEHFRQEALDDLRRVLGLPRSTRPARA